MRPGENEKERERDEPKARVSTREKPRKVDSTRIRETCRDLTGISRFEMEGAG